MQSNGAAITLYGSGRIFGHIRFWPDFKNFIPQQLNNTMYTVPTVPPSLAEIYMLFKPRQVRQPLT